jgi:hypothetical protein
MKTQLRLRRPWWIVLVLGAVAHLGSAGPAEAQLGALVSPGRLSKAHAQIEGVSNCLQCHSKGQQVSAGKCLVCHKPIAARIAAKKGIHRAVTIDCVACHVEHAGPDAEVRPFDQTKFEHTRDAGFALDGLHAPLAARCAACHKTRSFLTAQPACASCHADPHKGSLGPACSTCHTTSVKFAAALKTFDHAKAKFPLKGSHATVTCESCHKNKQYKGLAFSSCASCHTDPHKSKLGQSCESCHTETSWRTAKVDHARTAFPLRGKHASVQCIKCHPKSPALVKVRFDTCAACHADPHTAVFAPRDCGACHTESTFQKGTFDHTATKFPLVDKHVGPACVACHKTATPKANDFRGLKVACQSCHDDVHRGELGASCEKCHTVKSFMVPAFTHANQRPFFAGRHAPLTCAQCHIETMKPARTGGPVVLRTGFTTTPTACASCHKDVHLGQLTTACEKCHTIETARFGVVGFTHATTQFPLTGKHVPVPCEKCHKVETGVFPAGTGTARRFTGVGTACATCHEDPHRGQLDQTCQACHTTETFALPSYTHKNARALKDFFTGRHNTTCARCHTPVPGAPAGSKPAANYRVTTSCTNCHIDVHKGALGPDCAACHKP